MGVGPHPLAGPVEDRLKDADRLIDGHAVYSAEANVLLRVALLTALTRSDTMILDEPPEHLDARARRLLASSLYRAVQKGLLRQVIVSTYEERSYGASLIGKVSMLYGLTEAASTRNDWNVTPTYTLVRQAILDKNRIAARYNGKDRVLCPHCIGWKEGREQGLFFQCGGESNSGLSPEAANNWRCLAIDKLEDVRVVEGEWATADNHSVPTNCIDVLDVEVAY